MLLRPLLGGMVSCVFMALVICNIDGVCLWWEGATAYTCVVLCYLVRYDIDGMCVGGGRWCVTWSGATFIIPSHSPGVSEAIKSWRGGGANAGASGGGQIGGKSWIFQTEFRAYTRYKI